MSFCQDRLFYFCSVRFGKAFVFSRRWSIKNINDFGKLGLVWEGKASRNSLDLGIGKVNFSPAKSPFLFVTGE
jgi:hypothetical protein